MSSQDRDQRSGRTSPGDRESGGRERDDRDRSRSDDGRRADGSGGSGAGEPIPGPREWGGLARRGAARVARGDGSGPDKPEEFTTLERPEIEEWTRVHDDEDDDGNVRGSAAAAVGRGRSKSKANNDAPPEEKFEAIELERGLTRSVGRKRAGRIRATVEEAAEAYQRGRFQDTAKLLKPIAKEYPGLVEVRELLGLAAYRRGQWRVAIDELQTLEELVGSSEQHHVLADCYRALGHWTRVEDMWLELSDGTESDEVVNEARIVVASARADQGDPVSGIELIETALARRSKRSDAGLRLRYVLADLYERAGDPARARREFTAVNSSIPGYADVGERLAALA